MIVVGQVCLQITQWANRITVFVVETCANVWLSGLRNTAENTLEQIFLAAGFQVWFSCYTFAQLLKKEGWQSGLMRRS